MWADAYGFIIYASAHSKNSCARHVSIREKSMNNINEQNVHGNVAEMPAIPQEKDQIMLYLYQNDRKAVSLDSFHTLTEKCITICQELLELGYAHMHNESISLTTKGEIFCETESFTDPKKPIVFPITAQEKDNVLRELYYKKGDSIVMLNSVEKRSVLICRKLIRERFVIYNPSLAIYCITEKGEQFCQTSSFSFPNCPLVRV